MITNIKDWKKINENFSNVGTDEDGNEIGNCKLCNSKGVLIKQHECVTNEEVSNENEEDNNDLENRLYVGDFEI